VLEQLVDEADVDAVLGERERGNEADWAAAGLVHIKRAQWARRRQVLEAVR
jgi:hypothetical protein